MPLCIYELFSAPFRVTSSQIDLCDLKHYKPVLRVIKHVVTRPTNCQKVLRDSKAAVCTADKMCFAPPWLFAENTQAMITFFDLCPNLWSYRTCFGSFVLFSVPVQAHTVSSLPVLPVVKFLFPVLCNLLSICRATRSFPSC